MGQILLLCLMMVSNTCYSVWNWGLLQLTDSGAATFWGHLMKCSRNWFSQVSVLFRWNSSRLELFKKKENRMAISTNLSTEKKWKEKKDVAVMKLNRKLIRCSWTPVNAFVMENHSLFISSSPLLCYRALSTSGSLTAASVLSHLLQRMASWKWKSFSNSYHEPYKTDVVRIPPFMPGIMTKDKLTLQDDRQRISRRTEQRDFGLLGGKNGDVRQWYFSILWILYSFIAFHEFNLS